MTYVDLPTMRRYLDLADDIIADDDEIEQKLASVQDEFEESICHRTFTAPGASSARIYEAGRSVVYVDDAASFTLVEESCDETTWSSTTSWRSGPRNEPVQYKLHSTSGPFAPYVRVTAAWGFTGGPPQRFLDAIKLRTAALLDRRNSANGIAGEGQFGISRVSRYPDPDVMRLLESLIRTDRAVGLG